MFRSVAPVIANEAPECLRGAYGETISPRAPLKHRELHEQQLQLMTDPSPPRLPISPRKAEIQKLASDSAHGARQAHPFADFRFLVARPLLAAISMGTMSGSPAGSVGQAGDAVFGCL